MVRLELEKTNAFEVLDKYDVADIIKKNGIDMNDCFGKTKLVKVGKILNADKMLSGSVEKFGEKIILILRLVDVKSAKIEKTDVMEYLNQQQELQTMIKISIRRSKETLIITTITMSQTEKPTIIESHQLIPQET